MLFKKKKSSQKPRAIAFVDYENWYITLDKNYSMRPDLRAWRDELQAEYDVADILFFGDFSNPALRSEISRIREISSLIIETQNASSYVKKDFTDFIILDHIYQRALASDNVDVFVLFTGDGHFSSAASFLRNKCHKEVVVYGSDANTSTMLKNCANKFVAVPSEKQIKRHRQKLIVSYVRDLHREKENVRVVFGQAADAISKKYGIDHDLVVEMIRELVDLKILTVQKRYFSGGRFVKLLDVDENAAIGHALL